jgi:hypothetical protein
LRIADFGLRVEEGQALRAESRESVTLTLSQGETETCWPRQLEFNAFSVRGGIVNGIPSVRRERGDAGALELNRVAVKKNGRPRGARPAGVYREALAGGSR